MSYFANDHHMKKSIKSVLLILVPIFMGLILWGLYMQITGKWDLFIDNWFMTVTMIFGSFIAGASSEGGGAVAFPVMTLAFSIPPETARNFSLAIQSVGMTAASYFIIARKIRIELKYLLPVSAGGALGIYFGTIYIVPFIPPPFAKMLFVSFWLSFGLVLFYVNEINNRKTVDKLPRFQWHEKIAIFVVGMIGGSISSLLGSGLDIFSFSYVTMRYHLSEKVATPTSVVIMAINSIVGFTIHRWVLSDFGPAETNYWLVCIPVVIFGAPIGAYFINAQTRQFISKFLYIVIVLQFVGALLIIRPTGDLLYFSILVFVFGLFFFFGFSWLSKRFNFLK